MTENKAIEWLRAISATQNQSSHSESLSDRKEALYMAIQALEENQQYRAIGTVKGYERAIESSIENYNLYKEYKAKVQEFEAIGTVEEFKNAVEIIRPRKPYKGSFGTILCSLCGEKVGQMVTKTIKEGCMNFCANCGSLIDWSEWERSRHERSEKM